MKKIFTLAAIALQLTVFAQVKLDDKDFKNLVALAELSHENPNADGKDFDNSIKKLSTPRLAHIAETLRILDGANMDLLTAKYLNRPGNDELQMWYVISQISRNMQDDNPAPKPNADVAKEILNKNIDERWLVNDYYQHLYGGIAKIFNDKDLSKTNFDVNTYGLKNDTEKAIFVMRIVKPLAQRFMVLNQMKNPDKLLEFAAKMPLFNGKPYYYFTAFDYPDFEYDSYEGVTSYNQENMSEFYTAVMCHFMATAEKGTKENTRDIYFNSVLFKPEYFKFSGAADMLQQVYDESKKN